MWLTCRAPDDERGTGPRCRARGFNVRPDTNGESGDPDIDTMLSFTGSSIHKYTRDGQPLAIYPLVRTSLGRASATPRRKGRVGPHCGSNRPTQRRRSPVPVAHGGLRGIATPAGLRARSRRRKLKRWPSLRSSSWARSCCPRWTKSARRAETRGPRGRLCTAGLFAADTGDPRIVRLGAVSAPTRGGKRTAALTVIADLKGLGLRPFYMPAVWLLKDLVQVAEQNYPYGPSTWRRISRCRVAHAAEGGGGGALAGGAARCARSRSPAGGGGERECFADGSETLGQIFVINTPSI